MWLKVALVGLGDYNMEWQLTRCSSRADNNRLTARQDYYESADLTI